MVKRLDEIDRATGVLIILTVIGHIWQAGYIHNVIYSFHMPAFFIISGMLMHHTRTYERKYTSFLFNRLYSFGLPFLFFEVLGVLTDIIRHGVTLNIKGYIFNTVTLRYNDGNMWFIVSLFLIEAIFVAAKKILKKDWAVGIFCACIFTLPLLLSNIALEIAYLKELRRSFRYLFFFAAGFWGIDFFRKKNIVLVIVSCLIPPLTGGIWGKQASWDFSLTTAVFVMSGLAGGYAVLQLCKWKMPDKMNRLLTAAGRNSIIIYGTHHVIYVAVGVFLGITDFATTPLWAGAVMLLTVTALEFPTIYIINRWLPFLAGKRYKKQTFLHN